MNTAASALEPNVPSPRSFWASRARSTRMFACGSIGFAICAATIGVASQERRGVEAVGTTNVDLGVLLAFEPLAHDVVIKNYSWLSAFEGVGVSSSCGCTSASVDATMIGRRESARVTIVATPKSFDREVSATLHVRSEQSTLLSLQVYGEVLPPFAGWPDRVAWERKGNDLVYRIDPGYADWIKAGVAIIGGNEKPLRIEAGVDGAPMLVLDDASRAIQDGPIEIGLRFGNLPEGMNWWGWSEREEDLSRSP